MALRYPQAYDCGLERAGPGCLRDLEDAERLWEAWRQVHPGWLPTLYQILPAYCAEARLLLADYQREVLRISEALRTIGTLTAREIQRLLGRRPQSGR